MLVIEGTDSVGKTALCKELTKRLCDLGKPAVYRWFTKLPECWDYFWDYQSHIARWVVQDRFHMSELVYRACRDEPRRLQANESAMIDARIRLVGGLTVVLTASDQFLKERYTKLHDREMHSIAQIIRANQGFSNITKPIALPRGTRRPDWDITYHVDHDRMPSSNEDLVTEIIETYLERQAGLESLVDRKGLSQRTLFNDWHA
jgi:thymidylate kinase